MGPSPRLLDSLGDFEPSGSRRSESACVCWSIYPCVARRCSCDCQRAASWGVDIILSVRLHSRVLHLPPGRGVLCLSALQSHLLEPPREDDRRGGRLYLVHEGLGDLHGSNNCLRKEGTCCVSCLFFLRVHFVADSRVISHMLIS